MKKENDHILAGVPVPPEDRGELTPSLRNRKNGKSLCTMLKLARKALANANGIPYEIETCPNEGPCPGTCEKCDAEIKYFEAELAKIPKEKRVYPELDINPFRMSTECKASPNYEEMIVGCLKAPDDIDG